MVNFDRFFAYDIKSFNGQYFYKRTLASWFYISTPNNNIINEFTNAFIKNALESSINHPYFLHHYTITDVINKNKSVNSWYISLHKISAFQQRIDASILHNDINKQLTYPEWFHPLHIKENIDKNLFYVIKLRHKRISSEDRLVMKETIFHHLYDYCKKNGKNIIE